MKLPKIFVPEKDLEDDIKNLLKGEIKPQQLYIRFKVINTNTYADGIAKLKKECQNLFTFVENIEARISDYEANGKSAELFQTWLDSVTGIAYKANSTKFKLILKSDKLENIKPDFNKEFIPIDYDTEQGIEFDNTKGNYNQLLTREEAKNHEFWLAVTGGNKEKLARYVDIWFDKTGRKRGMGIYLRSTTVKDELRAIVLSSDAYNSDAHCYSDFDNHVRFVSGA